MFHRYDYYITSIKLRPLQRVYEGRSSSLHLPFPLERLLQELRIGIITQKSA